MDRAELRELAAEMFKAQATEIGEMHSILQAMGVMMSGEDRASETGGRPDFGLVGDRRVPLTPSGDVEFIDFFVPHHEMAVGMAEHVIERGENPDVRAMAELIRDAQTMEIATMRSVREELTGEPGSSALPADPHMMLEMKEMMSSSGTALDVMFLREMISHHAAGVPTAHRAKPHVNRAELRSLSDEIYQAQAEEIGKMQRMLEKL